MVIERRSVIVSSHLVPYHTFLPRSNVDRLVLSFVRLSMRRYNCLSCCGFAFLLWCGCYKSDLGKLWLGLRVLV